jgi:hypothetical protein
MEQHHSDACPKSVPESISSQLSWFVNPADDPEEPISLVHSLGGCGGTLLSRCLGVLPNVALFSEVNPLAVHLFPQFCPLYQDKNWNHLLTPAELDRFSALDLADPANFSRLVAALRKRALQQNRFLVLRDYNYAEFIGIPFFDNPPGAFRIYDALPAGMPVVAIALIRHPIAQWRSLCKRANVAAVLNPERFCSAYLAFLTQLGAKAVFQYETFVREPEAGMRRICRELRLPFDPAFIQRFHEFQNITGDFSRHHEYVIAQSGARHLSPEIIRCFRASRAYQRILSITGYQDWSV